MSIEPDALNYVGVYEEPAGSYQVDNSDTPGDFLAFPYEEGTLQFSGMEQVLHPAPGKVRKDGDVEGVIGPRSCTGTLTATLHSHGTDCDGQADPPTKSTWALLRVLQTIMGGVLLDGGTSETSSSQTTVQSSTTTTVTVDAGHGSRFAAGGVIACKTGAFSDALEAREIKSVSSDTITVKEAFSASPVASSPVRGGVTVYLTEDPDSSLQVLIEGLEGSDGAVYRGMQGGFSLTLPVGGLGQIAFALAGAGWSNMDVDGGATNPVYGVYQPIALDPLTLSVPVMGSTTRNVVEESELTVEPGITYAPQRSGAAAETIARMVRRESRPVIQGSFVCPLEDRTWWIAKEARTKHAIFAQCGATEGQIMLISIPTVQIVDVQRAPSGEGIRGQRVTFRGRHDEDIAGSTEVGYSALRIHFV